MPPSAGSAKPPPGVAKRGVPTYRSWQPGFMPLRPLSLGDFLSLPMKAIATNRQVILGGPLLCVILTTLASSVAAVLITLEHQDYFAFYPYLDWGPMSAISIASIVVTVVFGLATDLIARAIVVPGVSRGILGERISLKQAWSLARPRLPQLALLYLLAGFVGAALLLAFAGIALSGGPAIGALLYLALIPGSLYAGVLVGIAVSALVLERLSATRAIGRAFSLLKGSSWRLIGNLFVIGFVLYFVVLALVFSAEIVLVAAFSTSSSMTMLVMFSAIFSALVSVIVAMVSFSFLGTLLTLMYVDLRIRTEGFDVDLAQAAESAAGR